MGSNSSYWLTRFIILRLMGFIYFIAFLSAYHQILPLIGNNGIFPYSNFLTRFYEHYKETAWKELPTVLWFTTGSDEALQTLIVIGLILAFFVMIGFANIFLMTILWFLYMSLHHVGQLFYGYGWEMQMSETGFLCIWLCPLFSLHPFPSSTPPPYLIILLFRWLIVRIMLGAGLIKIRGDSCWRDLTCMRYHYETQPIPNPLSWYLHQCPFWFQDLGVLINHFVELIVPFFLLLPWSKIRNLAGIFFVSFQILLILSGNLSFLNWLTIVPSLACFDDNFISYFVPKFITKWAYQNSENCSSSNFLRQFFLGLIFLLIIGLSFNPVMNLLSQEQKMNFSFDKLNLVNTYGAFGSVGKVRNELIIEGTVDPYLSNKTVWIAYEFKCKPGTISRRPCIAAPYHYRIDWQIWFAAMSHIQYNSWLLHFVGKLLEGDEPSLSLLHHNPFSSNQKPTHIRILLYEYHFTDFWSNAEEQKNWWKRKYKGEYLQPITLKDLKDFMNQFKSKKRNNPYFTLSKLLNY